MIRFTEQEYYNLKKSTDANAKLSSVPRCKQPKYHNTKVYVYADGLVSKTKLSSHGELLESFDSIKEYQRCQELRIMQRAGLITDLKRQCCLEIQPAFIDHDGKRHKPIVYKADFIYIQNDTEVVEDVKGQDKRTGKYLCTAAFRLKWKILQRQYPDKIFRLF